MAGDDSEKSREEVALEAMLGLGDQTVHNISPLLHQIEQVPRTTFMEAIPEDQFAAWISPVMLLRTINRPFEKSIVIEAILNRLSLGQLRAAAETAILNSKDGSAEDERIPVPHQFWSRSVAPDEKSPFWQLAGDITFSTSTGQGYARDFHDWVAFTGVRFDPEGVARLLQALGIDAAEKTPSPTTDAEPPPPSRGAATRHGFPALNDEILNAWYGLFLKAYPNGTKGQSEESARGMFPKHSVDREKVRKLFGPAVRGRPLKDSDKI